MSSIRRSFSIGAALSAIEFAHRAGLRAETRALDELTAEKAKAEIMTINVGTIGHTKLSDVTTMTQPATTSIAPHAATTRDGGCFDHERLTQAAGRMLDGRAWDEVPA